MRARPVLLALLFLTTGTPPKGDGVKWLSSPPSGVFSPDQALDIGEDDVYEVVASKKDVAILLDLRDRRCIAITLQRAKYFTGNYYKCPNGKTPYLVRAVYGQGGTGHYFVRRNGKQLLVEHGSLGQQKLANKSALIVNLEFEPTNIYTIVSMAE